MARPISLIAADIRRVWTKPYFGAAPYIAAMGELDGIDDSYGLDSGADIVLRFLGNAATFRGPDAKALKDELKALLPKRGRR